MNAGPSREELVLEGLGRIVAALPEGWGQINAEPDPNFRPLTAKDLEGYTEAEWQVIRDDVEGALQAQGQPSADASLQK